MNGEVVFELEFAPRPEYGLISCTATARRTASTARRARFLLCTFWLAQALALAGEVDRAKAVFERAAAFANDVGLLAEEVDEANARSAPD